MWRSEIHRIAFRKCTPVGYAIVVSGDLFVLAAVAFLPCLGIAVGVGWVEFRPGYLLPALSLYIASILVKAIGIQVAKWNGFEYRYEPNEAVWGVDQSERFTQADWERDYRRDWDTDDNAADGGAD